MTATSGRETPNTERDRQEWSCALGELKRKRQPSVSDPRIIAIGTSTPQLRMTQEQAFRAAGYKTERIPMYFSIATLACDISMVGLGCAGALPTLQRVTDFVRANRGRPALMLAVEICSACYYVDPTLETVIGNARCADRASAFLLSGLSESNSLYPKVIDFETLP